MIKQININTQTRVSFFLYPDNQPHVKVSDISEGDEVNVTVSLISSLHVMHLLQLSNSLDHLFAKKKTLTIPYLMGARFDRLMEHGDSVDLEVVANLINSCGFEKVVLFDVHSDVATVAIKNSINITNRELVDKYDLPNSIIICPDAGAVKKIGKYLEWNDNIVDVVYCTKSRDLSNGNLTIKVLEPEKCKDRNCVIIDDLCDGGGTFIGIANQIEPKHLTLIISHGIFSKGIMGLKEKFNKVIVSNSYAHSYDDKLIKTINIF
jgi:ribose-phosphate pyrophosphokinase